ncbi:Eukaryotic translation initiation factor 2D [Neolecta irregularis DAH-3]|uniref:Eukaryotic translation initiation factor 2D n=1 Tax=Neolecta irregularis (strain DAH-3) TaxID=1198029 RepID=A0A1U7LHV9_NEOID|nr:Eukaryotic translation initiation factor 2D [Neolecta irregularis DAH-3]|eukprot:OLL22237.1 Eukaryotic translation initiation factor 2D [Neolecta irregularis DAH-3]
MFKKPLSNLSPLAPLRRSDRRKLVEELLQAFPEVASSIAEDDLSQAKNHLVPEGILTGKFRTHLGEGGKIFVDPGNGEPLWFTCNDIMVPTGTSRLQAEM